MKNLSLNNKRHLKSNSVELKQTEVSTSKSKTSFQLPYDDTDQTIQQRNDLINQLKQEILELKLQIRPPPQHVNQKQLQLAFNQIKVLTDENGQYQKSINNMNQLHEKSQIQWNEQKRNLISKIEQVEVQNQVYKISLQEKQSSMEEMKTDLVQLSMIIKQMTQLNKNLNQKIQDQNHNIEQTNNKFFQEKVKGTMVQQLQVTIQDYILKNQKLEFSIKEKQKKIIKDKKILNGVFQRVEYLQSTLSKILTDISLNNPKLQSYLQQTKKILSEIISKISKNPNTYQSSQQKPNLTHSLVQKDLLIKKLSSQVSILQNLLQQKKSLIQLQRVSHLSGMKSLHQQLKSTYQLFQNQKQKSSSVKSILSEKNQQLTKLRTQFSQITSQINQLQSKIQNSHIQSTKLKQQLKLSESKTKKLHSKILQLQKIIKQHLHELGKTNASIKIYKDQIKQRDFQIIKLRRLNSSLSLQINQTQNSLITHPNKQETPLQKTIKDQAHQIQILKEMLKAKQIEQRSNYKKKPKSTQDSPSSSLKLPSIAHYKHN